MKKMVINDIRFHIELNLLERITELIGNSGTGKTLLFKRLVNYKNKKNVSDLVCVNKQLFNLAGEDGILNSLKKVQNGLVVIDQADDCITTDIENYILNDKTNYYLIIGRATNLISEYSQTASIVIKDNTISIRYPLQEGLL